MAWQAVAVETTHAITGRRPGRVCEEIANVSNFRGIYIDKLGREKSVPKFGSRFFEYEPKIWLIRFLPVKAVAEFSAATFLSMSVKLRSLKKPQSLLIAASRLVTCG